MCKEKPDQIPFRQYPTDHMYIEKNDYFPWLKTFAYNVQGKTRSNSFL